MTKKLSTTKKATPDFDYKTITSVEVACKHLNFDINSIPDLSMLPGDLGEKFKQGILCAIFILAINNGWVPDYSDYDQRKYYPWPLVSSSGFGFSLSYYVYVNAYSHVGSRLCFESQEKADYAGKQFPKLFEDFITGK
jgi:hypothetical protein